ncbi:F-box/LRR-repeat protein 2-like [Branchiostoma lanceolatum]|uniref:F-box/LRR-repeat protein 2-like n=1 Tax=Branchiostoma lanceolatum TaxID=7740 RepID=UPI00113327E7
MRTMRTVPVYCTKLKCFNVLPVITMATTDEENPVDPFSCLPDELILRVFSFLQPALVYLPPVAQVCKRWCGLCQDSSLWTSLKFSSTTFSSTQQEDVFCNILQRRGNVQRIDLSACWNLVTDRYLEHVGKNCSKLTQLNISGCRRITDRGLAHVANGCKKLRNVVIHACPEITCQGVVSLAKQCVNLEELTISDCEGLWRDPHRMRTIPAYCTRLKCFNVGWSSASRGIVIDLDIKHFAMYCTQLRHLNVRSSQITDNGIAYIAQYCRLLEHLDLGHCFITDTGMKCRFPRLRHLDLNGCWHLTDSGLKYLAANNPNLEYLNIDWCFRITDKGIEHLAKRCPKLRHISMAHCFSVSNRGIKQLSQNCPGIAELNVSGNFLLTDKALRYLSESNTVSLRTLNVEGCTRLTDQGMGLLLQTCGRLERLNVRDCRNLSPDGMWLLNNNIHVEGLCQREIPSFLCS